MDQGNIHDGSAAVLINGSGDENRRYFSFSGRDDIFLSFPLLASSIL
jgi:hypothetical protein